MALMLNGPHSVSLYTGVHVYQFCRRNFIGERWTKDSLFEKDIS